MIPNPDPRFNQTSAPCLSQRNHTQPDTPNAFDFSDSRISGARNHHLRITSLAGALHSITEVCGAVRSSETRCRCDSLFLTFVMGHSRSHAKMTHTHTVRQFPQVSISTRWSVHILPFETPRHSPQKHQATVEQLM